MAEFWDVAEKAGHDFTLVSNQTGISLYCCEWCGALLFVRQLTEVEIFHSPQGSTLDYCGVVRNGAGEKLKVKIKAMVERDYERLKNI